MRTKTTSKAAYVQPKITKVNLRTISAMRQYLRELGNRITAQCKQCQHQFDFSKANVSQDEIGLAEPQCPKCQSWRLHLRNSS